MGSIVDDPVIIGNRAIGSVLDSIARDEPGRQYGWIPRGAAITDGFDVVSWGQLYKWVGAVAHWLDSRLGTLEQKPEARQTIAYIGSNDLRYTLLLLAADRTNRCLLIPLPINTVEAQNRLLDLTKTTALLASTESVHVWETVNAARDPLELIEAPSLKAFQDMEGRTYPYQQDLDEFWHCAPLIIQTSGTTGNPKPLLWTNAFLSKFDLQMAKRRRQGCTLDWHDAPQLVTLSPSWAVAVVICTICPLFIGIIPLILPATVPLPPSFEALKETRKQVPEVDMSVMIPDLIRKMYRSPGGPDFIATFKRLFFVGAPLDEDIGDALSKKTEIRCSLGSTELGPYEYFTPPDREDWNWIEFDFSGGWSLEPFTDDLYEGVVHKDPKRPLPIFYLHPDLDVHRVGDLFRRHPDPAKSHLWHPAGRADDFVKLSNMTKFNAVQIEMHLDAHPAVERSVVGGDDHANTFVLIKPAGQAQDALAALDAVWPAVEAANKAVHPDAQLSRGRIVLVTPDKPFGVTAKGTTMRRRALADYAEEIKRLPQVVDN